MPNLPVIDTLAARVLQALLNGLWQGLLLTVYRILHHCGDRLLSSAGLPHRRPFRILAAETGRDPDRYNDRGHQGATPHTGGSDHNEKDRTGAGVDTILNTILWLGIIAGICILYLMLKYGPVRVVRAFQWRMRSILAGKYWGRERPATFYDAKYAAPYDTGRYEPIYAQVMRWLEGLSHPVILEIGSGTGVLAEKIIERAIPYRGFDFSGVAVAKATERVGRPVFVQADAYDPNAYAGEFNTAILLEVLEHLDDFRVLQNIPGGTTLIASVPNYRDPGHVRTYPSEEVIRRRFTAHLAIDEILTFPVGGKHKLFLFRGTRLPATSC